MPPGFLFCFVLFSKPAPSLPLPPHSSLLRNICVRIIIKKKIPFMCPGFIALRSFFFVLTNTQSIHSHAQLVLIVEEWTEARRSIQRGLIDYSEPDYSYDFPSSPSGSYFSHLETHYLISTDLAGLLSSSKNEDGDESRRKNGIRRFRSAAAQKRRLGKRSTIQRKWLRLPQC